MHSTRRLLRLQRSVGFTLAELKLIARLCTPYTVPAADAATSLLRLSVDYDAFVQVLCGLVPQWKGSGGAGGLLEALFALFLHRSPPDHRHEADLELERRELGDTIDEMGISGGGISGGGISGGGISGGGIGGGGNSGDGSGRSSLRLSFEQLVVGLGWLLRGTSERRAHLCFLCFADGGAHGNVSEAGTSQALDAPQADSGSAMAAGGSAAGGSAAGGGVAGGSAPPAAAAGGVVRRERFTTLLASVYRMYEPVADGENLSAEAAARVASEAEQFVAMMYNLWDEDNTGAMDAPTFDRAAHQHPLLVQAFNLEQLELPESVLRTSDASPAPLGSAHGKLRGKNGEYLGLRPGAITLAIDDSYFDR